MSLTDCVLLSAAIVLACELASRIAKRRAQAKREFEARLARLFNEVRRDDSTKDRFRRFIPKDPWKP